MRSEQLGDTGEALLVNRQGVVQSPLKFYEDAICHLTIKSEPARRAAEGERGRTAIEDYRREPVMAAFGRVDERGFGASFGAKS